LFKGETEDATGDETFKLQFPLAGLVSIHSSTLEKGTCGKGNA
jgi:hypothetical protein